MRRCKLDGCENRHHGNGFCQYHYNYWYRYNDPTPKPVKYSDEEIERRRKHAASLRARLSPEVRSAYVSKGNRTRRANRLAQLGLEYTPLKETDKHG